MDRIVRLSFTLVLTLTLVTARAAAADPPWQLKSADGKSILTFGILAQPQLESLTTPDGQDVSTNVFMRRVRFMAGGKVSDWASFFVETDSPNLGKATADGTKTQDFFIQDAIFTITPRQEFQIDSGMLLLPLSHNTGQSAGTLLALDYGPYSFLASDPTTSRVGRDYGVEARGYVAGHLEYRAGAFQGKRGVNATAPLRYFGRVVWYPFDAETGFFYSGTTFGAKRIVALGASIDHQDDYDTRSVDVYVDRRVHGGDAATMQVNLMRYEGGAFLPQLPAQTCWLLEAGYYLHSWKIEPFVQFASKDPSNVAQPDERKYEAGAAYWANGHRYNVKLAVARMTKTGSADRTQVALQAQIFFWQ